MTEKSKDASFLPTLGGLNKELGCLFSDQNEGRINSSRPAYPIFQVI
jgi:hypothetical protein